MKAYQIWAEGYLATGDKGLAHLMGVQEGKTFKIACIRYFKEDKHFDEARLAYWGCRLYDNEADARRFCG